MNLKSARKVAEFVELAQPRGSSTIYKVPGHGGRAYYVQVAPKWDEMALHVTCRKPKSQGGLDCPGAKKTVCYHALGAVAYHLGHRDLSRIILCESYEDALRLVNLDQDHRKALRIVSTQSGAEAGVVVPRNKRAEEKGRARIGFKTGQTDEEIRAEQKAATKAAIEKSRATLAKNRKLLRGDGRGEL